MEEAGQENWKGNCEEFYLLEKIVIQCIFWRIMSKLFLARHSGGTPICGMSKKDDLVSWRLLFGALITMNETSSWPMGELVAINVVLHFAHTVTTRKLLDICKECIKKTGPLLHEPIHRYAFVM